MIEVRGLRVVYGRTVALDAVDLDLAPSLTGVFGPNGSGKSTLLRVLAGLLRPVSGEVLIDGRPLRASDESIRRRIGYAGHEAGLYAHLTVLENLELFARLYGSPARRPAEMIDAVGLGDRANTPVADLSAGLKRRASVGRAILHDPDVLLLDEPYANLDDDASDLVGEVIRSWHRPERLALIATHGAKRVRAYASHGIVLRRGLVAAEHSYEDRRAPELEETGA